MSPLYKHPYNLPEAAATASTGTQHYLSVKCTAQLLLPAFKRDGQFYAV
jgi:hypothetical protein